MSRLLFSIFLFALSTSLHAQTDILRGHWICKAEGVHLHLDLGEESINVPQYEFLGPMNGYMRGGMSETWFLVSFKQSQTDEWTMRFSNESGSDTQELKLQRTADGTLRYKAIGTRFLRRAVKRKWVYLPEEMLFEPT